jgi:hypothetical protein
MTREAEEDWGRWAAAKFGPTPVSLLVTRCSAAVEFGAYSDLAMGPSS